MTTTKKTTAKQAEKTRPAAKASVTKTKLQKGVTPEPRNKEEMDMKYIVHSPSLVDIYLSVSDDKGHLIGDNRLEKSVISFIDDFKDKEIHELKKPAVVLSKLRSLVNTYTSKLERTGNITDGIQTKSGIRRGELLNIEKKWVQKSGKDWVKHYIETYGKRSLRSAQDYMALANASYMIPYAFLRKERLMACLRAIKSLGIKDEDPMKTFFEKYSIAFSPENSQGGETMEDLKLGIDSAIAITRIEKKEQLKEMELGISPDYIRKLIKNSISINNAFIDDLFIIEAENGADGVMEHIKGLIGEEDSEEDSLLPHIKTLKALPQHIAGLKETIDSINEHGQLVDRIDQGQMDELEQFVTELKSLVQNGVVTG